MHTRTHAHTYTRTHAHTHVHKQFSSNVERCLCLAALLPNKAARDVALRLRWMEQQQQQQFGGATFGGGHNSQGTRLQPRRKSSRQTSFR